MGVLALAFLMMVTSITFVPSSVSSSFYVNGASYSLLAPLQVDRLGVQTQLVVKGVDVIELLQQQTAHYNRLQLHCGQHTRKA
jgi:hypothetical protein